LRAAAGLPDLLAAGSDAFEIIRLAARNCGLHTPELFAALVMAADAGVDGRQSRCRRSGLSVGCPLLVHPPSPDAGAYKSTAALVALLGDRLARTATAPWHPATRAHVRSCGSDSRLRRAPHQIAHVQCRNEAAMGQVAQFQTWGHR